jgi:hypothetical protein
MKPIKTRVSWAQKVVCKKSARHAPLHGKMYGGKVISYFPGPKLGHDLNRSRMLVKKHCRGEIAQQKGGHAKEDGYCIVYGANLTI